MTQRALVSGGAGFIGSHLVDALLARGAEVIAVDDFSTGHERNIAHLDGETRFSVIRHDIAEPLHVEGPLDLVLNFASPASPPRYGQRAIETLRTGSRGTEHMLQLAEAKGCRFIHASTSEVYGDPAVHPQTESYWGHVNPIGERSMYDEAKRFGEAICVAYARDRTVNVGIVRIFNTYGPRLDPTDGRVVSNFLSQALQGESLTVYGDGMQTRSFCYVDDEVAGILALAESSLRGPVNIGNPNEFTMLELADVVREVTGCDVPVIHRELPSDDPLQRCPDISLAAAQLGWKPHVELREGLARTAEWYRSML